MISDTDSPVAFSPELPRILRAQGWARVELLDDVGSTNTHAVQAATPWHLVAAHRQRAGRGRLARSWQAPAGTSVALSVTMPLPVDSSTWGWIPLFAGVAALEAVEALRPKGEFALKWPNDLLAREASGPRVGEWAKLAGILCQVVAGEHPLVVVGIGINVSQTRDELPIENATSMRLLGADATRDELLIELGWRLQELGQTWGGERENRALRVQVRRSCSTIGQDVVVHTSDGTSHKTRAVGIDADGRLLTRVSGALSEGSSTVMADTVAYSVGDVEHVRPAQEAR